MSGRDDIIDRRTRTVVDQFNVNVIYCEEFNCQTFVMKCIGSEQRREMRNLVWRIYGEEIKFIKSKFKDNWKSSEERRLF